VPYRQWVLTLPGELAHVVAADGDLATAVFGVFADELARWQQERAPDVGLAAPEIGCVLEIQRFRPRAARLRRAFCGLADGRSRPLGQVVGPCHRSSRPGPARARSGLTFPRTSTNLVGRGRRPSCASNPPRTAVLHAIEAEDSDLPTESSKLHTPHTHYGMAEATLAMTFSRLDDALRTEVLDGEIYATEGRAVPLSPEERAGRTVVEFVSCGWVWPDHEILIMDEDGLALPDRQVGEVVFRGPSVAAGYFENHDATAKSFRRDGLRTGDLGYLVDGELFVTGRKKDLIILNGRNYDPQSIEWVVAEIPGVRQGNVIAFSRPGANTEELVVVAETKEKEDLQALAAPIREAVRENHQMNPADIVLLPAGALPKTTSGKLQRQKARAHYLEGTLGVEGVRTRASAARP